MERGAILPLLLLLLACGAAARPATAAVAVVVDPGRGADSNSGSRAAPLRTLAAARDAARRQLAQPGACGVSVQLAPGRHVLPAGGLRLDDSDSGHSEACDAIWSGSGAVISGGVPVAGPWRLYDKHRDIWSAPLPAGLASPGPRQLYIGGRRAFRARSVVNTTNTKKHGTNGQWIPGCFINSSNPSGCNFTVTTTGFILQTPTLVPSAAYCPSPSGGRSTAAATSGSMCELEMAWTGRADAWNAPRCPVCSIISRSGGAPPLLHTTEYIMAQPCWENGAFKKGKSEGTFCRPPDTFCMDQF